MTMAPASKKVNPEQARETGLALTFLALLIAWFTDSRLALLAGLLLQLMVMLRPLLFAPLTAPWLAFARHLGVVSNGLLLGVVFYCLVTPVGLLRRFFGADPLRLRQWRQGDVSVFRCREHRFCPEDLENPY